MNEVFFQFFISAQKPRYTIQNAPPQLLLDACTFEAASVYVFISPSKFVSFLHKNPNIQFLLQKSDIQPTDVMEISAPREMLLFRAKDIANRTKGRYITTTDLVAAHLLLNEPKTKLLFSNYLTEEEFIHVVYWTRFEYKEEEFPKPFRAQFLGEGIADEWVSGWTLETQKYTKDLTTEALLQEPVLVGREQEYRHAIEALQGREKNSILLIGDSGSGKETLVEKLACDSFSGLLPQFPHKRVLQVMVSQLISGVENQGALEKRLQSIIEEVSHAGNVILYIPDIENIMGASTFHLDLSAALLPYLQKGSMQIIGTVTKGHYKKYLETNPAVVDTLTVIPFDEPGQDKILFMLLERARSIEKMYRVSLTYRAIVQAMRFASMYSLESVMPGSAVSLLMDAANHVFMEKKVVVEEQDITQMVEQKTHIAIGSPTTEEKDTLLHFEERMHERLVDQAQAVSAIAQALRRIRSGVETKTKPVSFLFLGPTGVGKTETAKRLANLYFGGEHHMVRLDMSEYQTEDSVSRLIGSSSDSSGESIFVDSIRQNPAALILLDEFEKAQKQILDLFLQVLSDGRLTDATGRTVSFMNTLIIATANAGSEFIREQVEQGKTIDAMFQRDLLDELQKNGQFRPELLNRFDEIVVFKPLSDTDIAQVTKLMLSDVIKKLLEQDITVAYSDSVVAKVVREGEDRAFGARPIQRYIQHKIEDLLSQKILSDQIKRGDKILITTDTANSIVIQK